MMMARMIAEYQKISYSLLFAYLTTSDLDLVPFGNKFIPHSAGINFPGFPAKAIQIGIASRDRMNKRVPHLNFNRTVSRCALELSSAVFYTDDSDKL